MTLLFFLLVRLGYTKYAIFFFLKRSHFNALSENSIIVTNIVLERDKCNERDTIVHAFNINHNLYQKMNQFSFDLIDSYVLTLLKITLF